MRAPALPIDGEVSHPEWFAAFLADRGTGKPSTHTMKAYRQDFDAIAALIVGSDEDPSAMSLGNITTEAMRAVFAQYAETHEAASIRRAGIDGDHARGALVHGLRHTFATELPTPVSVSTH